MKVERLPGGRVNVSMRMDEAVDVEAYREGEHLRVRFSYKGVSVSAVMDREAARRLISLLEKAVDG